MAMYRDPLVQSSFIIPQEYCGDGFKLKALTLDYVGKDYTAVKESVDVHGNLSAPENLTREQNLINLAWHQKEFQKRSSFAYTVLSDNESRCLGCVYIYPSSNRRYDAEILPWVTRSWYQQGGDKLLYQTVRHWVETAWPFKQVHYGI